MTLYISDTNENHTSLGTLLLITNMNIITIFVLSNRNYKFYTCTEIQTKFSCHQYLIDKFVFKSKSITQFKYALAFKLLRFDHRQTYDYWHDVFVSCKLKEVNADWLKQWLDDGSVRFVQLASHVGHILR